MEKSRRLESKSLIEEAIWTNPEWRSHSFLSLPYFFFPFLTSSPFHPLYPPPLPFPFIPHALTHLSLYFNFFFYFGITSFLNLFPFVEIQCNFLEPSFPFVSTTPWVLYRFPPLHHQNLSRKMNSTVCKHRTKLFLPIGGQLGGNWGWEWSFFFGRMRVVFLLWGNVAI